MYKTGCPKTVLYHNHCKRMIHHLVFYLCRSLGIQQQACFKYSTAHVWCVLWGVFTFQMYPIHHGQGFFFNQDTIQHGQLKNIHRMISDGWMSTINITLYIPVTFSGDCLIRQWDNWMTGHVTSFFCIQPVI